MQIQLFTDLRFTESETPTGVGKHVMEMARGLAKQKCMQLSVLCAADQADGGGTMADHNELSFLPSIRIPFPWHFAEAIWTMTGLPLMDSWCQNADWVYCPKNDFIPLKRTKLAVTIHGAHELDPAMTKQKGIKSCLNRFRRRLSYKMIVNRADLILTVSDFLKKQIIDWFGADETKIEVVGNGVEDVFFEEGARKGKGARVERPKPYLLCVGGLNAIDGGYEILETAEILKDTLPEIQFLVAGWQHEPLMLRRAETLPNIKLLGYVKAPELAELMGKALALFYLTRYETFGIAAAEAMAAGTPVLTAGGTAVPEIVGDAALYTSRNPHDIVDSIRDMATDCNLRAVLRAEGMRRAEKYTWQACVDRLINALQARS